MKDKFVSKQYSKNPEDIAFNKAYVEKNRHHTEAQYTATKLLIEEHGQTKPIYIKEGLCVDGRHRTKIAKELGREVLCIDLNPELTSEEVTLLSNEEILSGRDYNISQRAIWALRELVLNLGMSMAKAATTAKVDRRMVSYASTIRGLDREDVLDALMKGERVEVGSMDRPSSSLEVICKNVKADKEKAVVVDDSERIVFNPDAIIKTEQGKEWYYSMIASRRIPEEWVDVRMDYMEMANLKHKDSNK